MRISSVITVSSSSSSPSSASSRSSRSSTKLFSTIQRPLLSSSLILLLWLGLLHYAKASNYVGGGGDSSSLLKSFLRARCGPTGAGIWVYTGRLVDPLNGSEIAQVQGVELVRCLATTDASAVQRERYQRRCGDLSCAETIGNYNNNLQQLDNSNGNNNFYAGTLLSRKLFCYCTPSTSFTSSLLQKVRLRPTSPERKIPVSQAAAVYDTATTFCQLGLGSSTTKNNNNNRNKHDLWAIHTEYPDGRSIWTTTRVARPQNQQQSSSQDGNIKELEFTAYARPIMPRWRQKLDLSRIMAKEASSMQQQQQSSSGKSGSSVSVSPKRSSWIQLGSNPEQAKFGARETYHYTMGGVGTSSSSSSSSSTTTTSSTSKSSWCRVRYTRYGEGPLWYGPGRLCTLELTGRRLERNNWSDVAKFSSVVARLAQERVLGFLSVNSPVSSQDDIMAKRAVDWFRGKGSAKLQLAPLDADNDDPSSLLTTSQDRAGDWFHRLRRATSVSIGSDSGSSSIDRGGSRIATSRNEKKR